MQKKSIDIHNKTIRYGIEGDGRPVVLLHGFGEDSSIWENQLAFLHQHYQLIVPDIPGSGSSDLTSDVTMEAIADIIQQIIEAEELERVVLIGHSMGGYITLAFAEKYPQLLDGLGLFHSSGVADSVEKKQTRQKGIDFIRKNGAAAFLQSITPNLFSDASRLHQSEMVETYLSKMPSFSNAALIAYYEAMMARPERIDILSQTDMPVLFIIGEHDSVIPFEDVLKQASMPRVSHIHILHQSGHLGMLEEPQKANEAIEAFLLALP